MLMIDDILIQDQVIQQQFLCNLSACKGACCWEGDMGAPLEEEECQTLQSIYPDIRDMLEPAGIQAIEEQGTYTYNEVKKEHATPLVDGGPCAYMVYDKMGIARCGIERAYKAGKIDFIKPISCHLYPIRVTKLPEQGFEALNYDEWEICAAACDLGAKEKVPVYQFVSAAIIRHYGEDFYHQLDAAAKDIYNRSS
jgi:hypothetical protein